MAKHKYPLKVSLISAILVGALALGIVFINPLRGEAPTLGEKTGYEACFTPPQKCLPLIQRKLAAARDTIRVMSYSFTSKPIADALLDAHRSSVKVTIVADKNQAIDKRSQLKRLSEEGITVLIDHKPAIQHSKILILDASYLLTGSYNWSAGAEHRNSENLLFVSNKDLASQYIDNFNRRMAESKPLHVYLKEGKEYRFGR